MTTMRIRLAGDHSVYHCGSAAAFASLRGALSRRGELVNGEDYDELYVNGEGSMHHDSHVMSEKMKTLRQAIDSGRPAHLVNTIWQENGGEFDDVLRGLTSICVRETLSQRDLAERHGIPSEWRLDSSFHAELDAAAPVHDWRGRIVITDFFSREHGLWVRISRGSAEQAQYVDMRDLSWSSLVASLATARMLMTGRHHAVYAACRARVPFVAVRGNTHKIEGLIAASGLPIPVADTLREVGDNVTWAKANRRVYEELFDWMAEQPAWTPPAA